MKVEIVFTEEQMGVIAGMVAEAMRGDRPDPPKPPEPPKEEVDWDQWLGPAPFRPYHRAYHPWSWRAWTDFGTGALGDMACHTTNLSVMALELWDPSSVTAIANPGIYQGETYPGSSTIKFEFPKRGDLPACTFSWYDGGNLPGDNIIKQLPEAFQKRVQAQREGKSKTSGAVLIGSKGLLFSPDDYGAQYVLLPEANFKDFKKPEQSVPRIPFRAGNDQRQKWEFVSTIKGDYPGTMANFGYAGRLTETILVGNLALRAGEGQKIEWDPKSLTSSNRPEINAFVHREYRAGWEL
jgi:hypothetical protein